MTDCINVSEVATATASTCQCPQRRHILEAYLRGLRLQGHRARGGGGDGRGDVAVVKDEHRRRNSGGEGDLGREVM